MADSNTLSQPETDEVTSAEHTRCGCHYRPDVDILEGDDELTIKADVPGVKAEDIGIDFEDGTLTIRAKVQPRQDGTEYLIREYGIGDYYRSFRVSETIDASKISAEYADGVLTLHLPKSESSKPRKIGVKAL